tara:strand:- start:8995 stop:10134 length:1140 start_codon:yes stop_codon:yes gene_type:complete
MKPRTSFRISLYDLKKGSIFDQLFEIFKELITYTSGDVDEAIAWLKELDKEYHLTTEDYTIDDFLRDLFDKGYLKQEIDINPDGSAPGDSQARIKLTAKLERDLRRSALEQIFGNLKKSGTGNHKTKFTGEGDEKNGELRSYQFGDRIDQISMTESLKNAFKRVQSEDFNFNESDLVVEDSSFKAQMSTILMIDISHSMILYGEDRITPAKKVAMALAELITTRYPKDTLDVIVFGNDSWPISIADLPYLKVGPYHTNTVAGLELAMSILRRKKYANRQIFMITDGKPSCIRLKSGEYYKNSVGLDETITGLCYQKAEEAKKAGISITTFMIAQDPYLTQFIKNFTEANQGKAYYSGLSDLGELIFDDYKNNRKRKLRG